MITEVSLKVLPVAPAEATLRFAGISQADALQRLNQWGGQPLPLNASRWLEEGATGMLYVRLRGAAAAVEAACQKMGGERMESAQAAIDWIACREQQLPWFQQPRLGDCLWRLSVPPTAPVQPCQQGLHRRWWSGMGHCAGCMLRAAWGHSSRPGRSQWVGAQRFSEQKLQTR